MKYLICFSLSFFCVRAASQTFDAENVKLSILKDTLITLSNDPRIKLDFEVKNISLSNLILYRLKSDISRDQIGNVEGFCEIEKISAGMTLYVFDEKNEPVTAIHWYVQGIGNPITKEKFDSLMSRHKNNSLKATVILGESEIRNFKQEVDLREFHLNKGRYFIQLLYFAGRRITNFVSEGEISNDKKLFNAEVYQGCVISNRSLLIVN